MARTRDLETGEETGSIVERKERAKKKKENERNG